MPALILVATARADVAFLSATSSGLESAYSVTLPVVLSPASASTVTVAYAVSGGTASNGLDYGLPAGTLTFLPGVTSQTIAITVTNDFKYEGSETIAVTLSNAVNDTLVSPDTHTYTILGDSFPYSADVSVRGYNRTETLTNFPLLVVLGSSITGFSYYQFASTNGAEMRFFDAADNELKYEIDTWNTNGDSFVWLRVPLFTNNMVLRLYWGSTNYATMPAYVTNGSTWAADFAGVWHLGANERDSTANGNHGTNNGGSVNSEGMIGDGQEFDGLTGFVEIPNSATLENLQENNFTVSAWYWPATVPPGSTSDYNAAHALVAKEGWHEDLVYYNSQDFGFEHWLIGDDYRGAWSSEMPPEESYHVVGVLDRSGGVVRVYVNGELEDLNTFPGGTVTREYGTTPWRIGSASAHPSSSDYGYPADGILDEVRLESTFRSANWIWASFQSQASNGAFLAFSRVSGVEVEVLGSNAAVIADGDITPQPADGTDFGIVNTKAASTHTFTITNRTDGSIGIGLVTTNSAEGYPADFIVVSQPAASLPAHAATAFEVMFSPSGTGPRWALVEFTNTSSELSYRFGVMGTGIYTATEFVCDILPSGGDYVSVSSWVSAVACDLVSEGTRVFSGAVAGVVSDGDEAILHRAGLPQPVTGTVVHATAQQILVRDISDEAFSIQTGDVWRVAVTNGFTISSTGDSAAVVARISGVWTNPDGRFIIDGFTTSTSNYVRVHTVGEARHRGSWNTLAYRVDGSNYEWQVEVKDDYVQLDGLQIHHKTDMSYGQIASFNVAAMNVQANAMIIWGEDSFENTMRGVLKQGPDLGVSLTIRNSLIYGDYDEGISSLYFSSDLLCFNCTVVVSGAAYYRFDGRVFAYNCYASAPLCYAGDSRMVTDHCASSDDTGSPGLINLTTAPSYLNPGETNFHLRSDSPCIDAGQNSEWMADSMDLDGNPRLFNGRVDVGADEFTIETRVRALLEGPYDAPGDVMQSSLLLPALSPYCEDPRLAAAIPTNAIDWVLVQLLDTNSLDLVASHSFFIRGDGEVMSDEGAPGVRLECTPNSSYYIVLKHRNHLSAMTAAPVGYTNTDIAFDFTTGSANYAGGSSGAVEVEPGVWGLAAGDADGDGRVRGADQAVAQQQSGRSGYLPGDLNLDGDVDAGDEALATNRLNRVTLATNGAVNICPQLVVRPSRKTVVSSNTVVLGASGSTNTVTWLTPDFSSGGTSTTLNATSVLYQAGNTSDCVDVIEAWDGDYGFGRAYLNVIGPAEVAKAGRAVIIAGTKGGSDPLWPATEYLANNAYNVLLYRGYSKENVRYLSQDAGADVDGNGLPDDVDLVATSANVEPTFDTWAGGVGKLFVYLIDHGGNTGTSGYFRLNSGESVTGAELDGWLDDIQNTYTTEVTVVLDFCNAKAVANELTYTGIATRIVIASSDTNESAYFLANGLVSFSDAFFGGILMGQDVITAYGQAQEAMSDYQTASYVDNGNGQEGTGVVVGASFVAGKDLPQIGLVAGRQALAGGTTATLWAQDIVSGYPVDRVWCVVVPPGHTSTNTLDPVQDIPETELTYSPQSGRYEGEYDGFTEGGTYRIIYYARDLWDSVSLPKQSYVEQVGYDERMVIVAGGPTTSLRRAAIEHIANAAYRTAVARGIPTNNIVYLSETEAGNVNGPPTLENLAYVVTNWAWSAAKLTLYLVGEGSNDVFQLTSGETLSAAVLGSALDAYQVANRPVQVVMDFAGAGAFVPYLDAPANRERISVASTRSGFPCVMESDGLVSFSEYFLSEIFAGRTIGQAEAKARKVIRRASGLVRQRSGLDDDGDGVMNEKNQDGLIAAARYIGGAFATGGEGPNIGSVIGATSLVTETSLLIWAGGVTDADGVSNVWCMVTPPEYDDTGDLVRVDLSYTNSRWEALYTNFTNAGHYVLTFYAGDNAGDVSPAVQSEVIRPDKYEVDDEHVSAHPYYVGTFEQHTFHSDTDEDWVWFYAQTGYVYDIETVHLGTNVDTVLDVYFLQPDGTLTNIDHIDDFAKDEGELTGLNFPQEGMYFVQVSQYVTNTWLPGSYELVIDIPAGDGVLVVIAAIWPTTNALPAGSFASLDGNLKYFNGNVSVSYPTVSGGTHLLAVYSSDPNVVPVEDPNWPNQVNNPWNSAYGDPKYAQLQQVRRGQIAGSVGFSFIGLIRADGDVRDQGTYERVSGAGVVFKAASGYLTNYVINGNPFYATYKTLWASQSDGQFPNNVWLPAQTLHVTLGKTGYQDYNQNNVIVNPVAGSTPDVGTKYMVPVDNDGDGMADSWETQRFGTTTNGASGDVDGDGHNNWQEYKLGTSPTSLADQLENNYTESPTKNITLKWTVKDGRSYRVMRTDTLQPPTWTLAAGPWEATTGQTQMQWTANPPDTLTSRYFRIEALVP